MFNHLLHHVLHSLLGDSSVRGPGGASCRKLCAGPGGHEPSLLRAHYWHHVLLCRGGPQHPPFSDPQQLTDSAPDPSLPEPGRSQQRRGPGGGQGVEERNTPSPHACQLSGRAAGCREHDSQWVNRQGLRNLKVLYKHTSFSNSVKIQCYTKELHTHMTHIDFSADLI